MLSDEVSLLFKKISDLENQVIFLKEKLSSVEIEANKWVSKRDSLNEKCKRIWREIPLFKSKRDQLNQEIKNLKVKKEKLRTGLKEKRREYDVLKEIEDSLLEKTFGSETEIRRQIEKLDWIIQTNPLTTNEEMQIINKIRPLEQQEILHKQLSNIRKELKKLRLNMATTKLQIKEGNNQIVSFVSESQENHLQMLEKIKEVKEVKAKANHAHQRFLEYAKHVQENHSKYGVCVKKIKHLTFQINQIEKEKRRLRADVELEEQRKIAEKKLKDKKKISLEEFKALMKKDLV